ncbi:MAG TPA: hypothetical protein VEK15_29555 [Vicinamibacteria bacterium]|nr:hypothetical protein [Vicinamibacteria bacterium]
MTCPECGIEMTHHATKIVQPTSATEEAMVDPDLGGVALERHACAACGESASRLAEPGAK